MQETTINTTEINEYDIGIKEIFILNIEGSIILTSSLSKNYMKNHDDCIQLLCNFRHLKIKEYCYFSF